jgi:hypothetical protein
MPTFKDNPESIGRTPLVKINRISKGVRAIASRTGLGLP